MDEGQIKYIIADDHKIFRQGLSMILSNDPSLHLHAEVGNGLELIEILKFEQPDIILLDVKMPKMDGLEATKIIRAKYPNIKILILTMLDDDRFILPMIEAGANGYLIKNADADEIKLALHACAENGYYFSDRVGALMLKKVMGKGATPSFANPALNEREREVLTLLAEGLTAAEIGTRIYLSPRTVEGIKSSLIEKTGARNMAALVMYAVKHGLISAD
jgi:DNA-binding NarL/FixJ family response regulator